MKHKQWQPCMQLAMSFGAAINAVPEEAAGKLKAVCEPRPVYSTYCRGGIVQRGYGDVGVPSGACCCV
jgi:hypothetical protein